MVRAKAVTPDFRSGDVMLPLPLYAPWIADYTKELCAFRGNDDDISDQVDATSQALNYLREREGKVITLEDTVNWRRRAMARM